MPAWPAESRPITGLIAAGRRRGARRSVLLASRRQRPPAADRRPCGRPDGVGLHSSDPTPPRSFISVSAAAAAPLTTRSRDVSAGRAAAAATAGVLLLWLGRTWPGRAGPGRAGLGWAALGERCGRRLAASLAATTTTTSRTKLDSTGARELDETNALVCVVSREKKPPIPRKSETMCWDRRSAAARTAGIRCTRLT